MPNDTTSGTRPACGETPTEWDTLRDKGIARFTINRVQQTQTLIIADSWLVKPDLALSPKLTRQVPPMWHSASSRSIDSAVRPLAKSARIALAHNIGGPTAVSAGTILEGPGAYGS
ncbi:MAG: hypothetical protein QOD90_4298 [Mycobacterium sp.]|jgi:hypothetical protein|nr:hypothetical protein [Mycobacterium sp.]